MLQSVYIFNGTYSLTQQLKHLADFLYVYSTKNKRPETANRSLQTSNIHKGSPHGYMYRFFMFSHTNKNLKQRDGRDITAGDALSYIQFMKKKKGRGRRKNQVISNGIFVFCYLSVFTIQVMWRTFTIRYVHKRFLILPPRLLAKSRNNWRIFLGLYQTPKP